MSGRKVHLIGVGGVGMAGLALLLKAHGNEVSGCDLHTSARTRWLERNGIRFFEGHSADHVLSVDEVIVTPAVHEDNPERRAAIGRVRTRGEVLAGLVSDAPDSIAVCGSHGKTTTSTWIARLLLALGEPVQWAIGGETGDFPVAGVGSGVLVVEADESDGTLALYHAKTLVVTNCEYDHPDHFKTYADYCACYEMAKKNAAHVLDSVDGFESLASEIGLDGLSLAPHNRRNALMAAAVAWQRGHSAAAIAQALPPVVAELPDRRFQRITPDVYTDYAHHPTEMKCAIGMARKICRGRLRVLFQPHRYSRTKALLDDFPAAFEGVDEVYLCPTYAAFEASIPGGGVEDLATVLRATLDPAKTGVALCTSCVEAWEKASARRADGDLTLLLGAGDIIALVPRILGN